jgi:hypothetical protein
MDIKDIMLIISAIIVAAGWFVNGYLNRLKDVAQKRLDYRLRALEAFLPVWFDIQSNPASFTQPGFLQKLEHARSMIQLYGLKNEIEQMEKFIDSIQNQNLNDANKALTELVPLIRKNIRRELNIKGRS